MQSYLNKNFTQIPNELFQARTLDLKAIGLYAYLKYRSFFGNAVKAYPSQKKIMKDLKIGSDTTLRKIIRELEANEFLIVKKGSILQEIANIFYPYPITAMRRPYEQRQ